MTVFCSADILFREHDYINFGLRIAQRLQPLLEGQVTRENKKASDDHSVTAINVSSYFLKSPPNTFDYILFVLLEYTAQTGF